jgi:hypothetical protein
MTDGTTNAIVVGERYTPLVTPTTTATMPIGHAVWVGVTNPTLGSGLASALGDVAVETATAIVNSPFALTALTTSAASFRINGNNTQTVPRGQTTGFGSMHVGGAHFLLGDGSVKFITDNLDTNTYRNLGTMNDGNQVGEF